MGRVADALARPGPRRHRRREGPRPGRAIATRCSPRPAGRRGRHPRAVRADCSRAHGRPTSYDVIVLVGNVMIYLAEDTEVARPAGRMDGAARPGRAGSWSASIPGEGPAHSRDYPVEDFRRHVGEAGLVVEHVFGGYDLAPTGRGLRRGGPRRADPRWSDPARQWPVAPGPPEFYDAVHVDEMSMNKVIHGAFRRDLDRFVGALTTFRPGDTDAGAPARPGLGQLRRRSSPTTTRASTRSPGRRSSRSVSPARRSRRWTPSTT